MSAKIFSFLTAFFLVTFVAEGCILQKSCQAKGEHFNQFLEKFNFSERIRNIPKLLKFRLNEKNRDRVRKKDFTQNQGLKLSTHSLKSHSRLDQIQENKTTIISKHDNKANFFSTLTKSQELLQLDVAEDIFTCLRDGTFTLYANLFNDKEGGHRDIRHPLFGWRFDPLLQDILNDFVNERNKANYTHKPIPTFFRGEEQFLSSSLNELNNMALSREEWIVAVGNLYISQQLEEILEEVEGGPSKSSVSSHVQNPAHQEENDESFSGLLAKGKSLFIQTVSTFANVVSDSLSGVSNTIEKTAFSWWKS